MGNVKMVLVFVSPVGMDGIALWKAVQTAVLVTDSAALNSIVSGNVDAQTDGTEKIVACFWNKIVEMEGITIKVCRYYFASSNISSLQKRPKAQRLIGPPIFF